MLLTPRTYKLAQVPDKGSDTAECSFLHGQYSSYLRERAAAQRHALKMLLIHQTGSVKVGELFRYTLTYTPADDRILPHPSRLHVRIRNSSAIPLRAAYLHGPYTVHVAAYPASFNPNRKVEAPARDGIPQFEPNLKAGGSWTAELIVPDHVREEQNDHSSVSWIIEITSQIIFSNSASVSFELLVARDERSLDLGIVPSLGLGQGTPGKAQAQHQGRRSIDGDGPAQPRGVFSKAVKLKVEDAKSLWNKPPLPTLLQEERLGRMSTDSRTARRRSQVLPDKKKKFHLVILTHGLHGNLGTDMLYLKESIDAAALQAREDTKRRRKESRLKQGSAVQTNGYKGASGAEDDQSPSENVTEGKQDDDEDEDEDDIEEVVVRGFHGNVIRTEKGIQYLGKRLAKYVLELTYPDQPFLPIKKSVSKRLSDTFSSNKDTSANKPVHDGSSIHRGDRKLHRRSYQYTSISFVGHSLGGVVQTYAIAYIHKHSPEFFNRIQPVNFVALASPLLGLSNENPIYVKFALDFGLVGRTGQDLGLFWRTPAFARTGWSAMVGGLGGGTNKQQKQEDPAAKPLLRILPTGPAHHVLRMFRNRTLYSNAVNDGIVPLRTSCLLFLDWGGLGRVEKARRENGLIGTMAGWGWAELTGASSSKPKTLLSEDDKHLGNDGMSSPTGNRQSDVVPQPPEGITNRDDNAQTAHEFARHAEDSEHKIREETGRASGPLNTILNFLKPNSSPTAKDFRMYRRSQTIKTIEGDSLSDPTGAGSRDSSQKSTRARATATSSMSEEPSNVNAPPKTTVFESAGDILNPPIPPTSWIIDPSTRDRTIFHDRVYHPEDIPPPPVKRPSRHGRSSSSEGTTTSSQDSPPDFGSMKVEEKIARAYHRDLSWRKVLVRLEPDAHNNIIVRRMFANAYGWPVIKHLCDTHFADTYTASTRDEFEPATDRASTGGVHVGERGEEVRGQTDKQSPERSASEMREASDELAPLKAPPSEGPGSMSTRRALTREDSALWDDSYFGGTTDDEDDFYDERDLPDDDVSAFPNYKQQSSPSAKHPERGRHGKSENAIITSHLTKSPGPVEGHRGLDPEVVAAQSHGGAGAVGVPQGSVTSESSIPARSIAEIGLRKSLDSKPVRPSTADATEQEATSGSHSVSEQVARLSHPKSQNPGQS